MTATLNALFPGKTLPSDTSKYILFDLMTVSKHTVRYLFRRVMRELKRVNVRKYQVLAGVPLKFTPSMARFDLLFRERILMIERCSCTIWNARRDLVLLHAHRAGCTRPVPIKDGLSIYLDYIYEQNKIAERDVDSVLEHRSCGICKELKDKGDISLYIDYIYKQNKTFKRDIDSFCKDHDMDPQNNNVSYFYHGYQHNWYKNNLSRIKDSINIGKALLEGKVYVIKDT